MNPRSENPKDEGPYAWQTRDAAIQAGKLGINAYAIYCALTHFQSAAATDHKRRFSASYEQLAEHVGCSRGTVKTALDALEKEGLIRKFSGSNGGYRATRNAFFLTTISSPPHGRGSPPHERHVSTRGERHVSTPHGRFRDKENRFKAGPQAPAVKSEKEKSEPACSPLRGGSGPRENPEIDHELLHLSERDRNYILNMRAIAIEGDLAIAEQVRKKREAENFS
jgi:DNA-binding Lrp family transcriptional regulator